MLDAEAYRPDLVRLGLHKIAHQDVTLVEHVFRTCAILQDMRAGDHVCLAGLFHSVYGVEGSPGDGEAIPEGKRDEVRAIVGSEVEQMVFNFSVMSYASLGKSFRNMMRPHGVPELKDWRTGEEVRVDRDQFLDLLRMKLGDILATLPTQVGHTLADLRAEHADFWEMAAESLGRDAISTWNKFTGGELWIDPEQS